MKKSKLQKIIPVIMSAALALNPVEGFWVNNSVAEAAETNEIVTEIKPEDSGYFWHGNIKDLGDNKIKLETNKTNINDIQTTEWQIFFPIDVSGMEQPTIQVNGTNGSGYCKAYEILGDDNNSSVIWNYYTTDGITKDLTSIAENDADKKLFIEYKEINDNLSLYVYDAANYVNSVTNNNETITIASGEETEITIGSYSSIGNPTNIPIEINELEDFSSAALIDLIVENGTIKAKIKTSQVAFDEKVTLSAKVAGTTFNINVLVQTSPSFTFPEPPSEKTIINFEAKNSGYFWYGNIKDLGDNKIKLETNKTNINDIQTTEWQIFFPIDVSGMEQPTIQVNGTNGSGYCKAYEILGDDNNSSVIWNYYTTDGITKDLTSIAENDADKKLFIEYKEINDNLSLYVYDAANQLQSVTNNNTLIEVESGKTSSFDVGTYDYIGTVDIPIKIKPTGPVKTASLIADNGKLILSVTAVNVSSDTRVNFPAKIAGADFTIYLNIKASSGSGPDDTTETKLVEIQTSANADVKKKAVLVPETTADKNYNKAVVSLECAEDVEFNPYCKLAIVATVNGVEKTFTQEGIGEYEKGWKGSYDITEADGFSIKEGDTYKIEAYTDSWAYHTSSYVFKAGIVLSFQESSSGDDNTGDNNPGDTTEPSLVEIQTSANADVKKKAVLIPETTADKDYNKAVISLECAEDVSFNEHCNLVIVVTINGEEKTFTQKGIGKWENGWKGSYDITAADGFSIKKGDTYKIEAYTDSWEEHTLSYVFKAGIKLSYTSAEENPPVETDAGKIYCSTEDNLKLAVIMANSIALKDFNSLKIQVQCASDTSFNPWTSINFIVTINGNKYEKEVKGDDETYTNGALRNCVLDGFTVKKDDTISISACTYSWNDAADYVFKLSIEDVDSLVKLSNKPAASNTPRPIIAYNPGITASSAPSETKAPEATIEPSIAPATPSPGVSTAPTTIPADATNAPVTSTEEPGIPISTKAPEANPSNKPDQTNPDNASGNDKEDVKTINANGVKYAVINNSKNTVEYTQKTKNTANVKVPASIKVKVNGKTVTYKVTSIAANAFKNNTKLKTVTISKNIVKIGNNAFKGCKNIKTIKITSKKLTSKNVAKKAFKGIGDKKKVVIKVPKNKYKDYKKLLKNKGLGKKAVIKKY